jgi:hypothetical protein
LCAAILLLREFFYDLFFSGGSRMQHQASLSSLRAHRSFQRRWLTPISLKLAASVFLRFNALKEKPELNIQLPGNPEPVQHAKVMA